MITLYESLAGCGLNPFRPSLPKYNRESSHPPLAPPPVLVTQVDSFGLVAQLLERVRYNPFAVTGENPAQPTNLPCRSVIISKTEQLARAVPGCSACGDADAKGLARPAYKPLMRKPSGAMICAQPNRNTAGNTLLSPFPVLRLLSKPAPAEAADQPGHHTVASRPGTPSAPAWYGYGAYTPRRSGPQVYPTDSGSLPLRLTARGTPIDS